ncbi:MAG: hypothetical protein LBD50_00435 [Rickettsiales bacterium]|nr:hypothetical protein [Rickettsiales bacterium]
MRSSWGASGLSNNQRLCKSHNVGDACVGNSLAGCKNWNGAAHNQPNRGTSDDEMAILLLIARDVNANGAKFCVTQAQGTNKNKGNALTIYFEPEGGLGECFWLCKENYGGDGCTTPRDDNFCDSTLITKAKFANYKIATQGANIESQISMFYMNDPVGCGLNKTQEHDMVLAVSGWLPRGHGALVQPMVVRAERSGWEDMVSTATVMKVGTPTLLCKNGYKANYAKDDCDPVDPTKCTLTDADLCADWKDFNAAAHEPKYDDTAKCYKYRCLAGYAFKSDADKTCVECKGNPKNGANPDTGVCVNCETGKLFSDKTEYAPAYCRTAIKYSNQELAFGKGNDHNAELNKQCWTIISPDEYLKCVKKENEVKNEVK